ncbi:uncharacterized protein LOC126746306 [Anthonomus grandis grandis]|uniref:uncharacterized protein LOC126746306 n=1 Tax=Anthonomus grandis grandis TaxID=2921223 RepID=UPI0021654A71|nr:uncharacterized protein LOC126746306 [Anthonomus grandis grandis]
MSESEEETEVCESQMGFVNMLRDVPILLSKSQTPAVRKSKSQAIELINKQWKLNFGSQITTSQMYKKINNMKSKLKKKTDINRTGNKKIVLQDWEKILLEIMEGNTNPVLAKVPGALSVGIQQTETKIGHEDTIPRQSTSASETSAANDDAISTVQHAPKKKEHNKGSPLEEYETNVTKQLSNNELQRLVLLKQLRVLEMKEEKLKRQLNRDVDEQSNSSNNNIIQADNGQAYFKL